MTPLLNQFLSEAREFLQGISEMLIALEKKPGDADLMNKLFRLVHTLKGNTGLFDFPEMTRVLHAGEDLMDEVKNGGVPFSQDLADKLLNAMDFVSLLCDEIESEEIISSRAEDSVRLADALRGLITRQKSEDTACADGGKTAVESILPSSEPGSLVPGLPSLADIPETARMEAYRRSQKGDSVYWIVYKPEKECFFHGDDPFFTVRQTPGLLWGRIVSREFWPPLAELDAYSCNLDFHMFAATVRGELNEHFRYVADQIHVIDVEPLMLVIPNSDPNDGPVYETENTSQLLFEDDVAALAVIFDSQRQILRLDDHPAWRSGRLKAVAAALINCCMATGDPRAQDEIQAALDQSLTTDSSAPLLAWLENRHSIQLKASLTDQSSKAAAKQAIVHDDGPSVKDFETPTPATVIAPQQQGQPASETLDDTPKFGRRAEDVIYGAKVLKVDQAKIDRLMNLIGEMVVSKNALPYLALRAENQYGVRELSREIKSQYAIINRIAEEMQDGIMQVRMMPVSFIFQRFPRLVRDLSRKLEKEVELVLDGEETEADKNIIESLADPLIHIIRNSLDHGLETPDVRRACGKPVTGTITILAAQEGDRVIIEIIDDGKGIDPAVIKRMAYEKGIIDEAALERISDREAINLVFAPGFSTAEAVSDLSGRGVG
ncbi:MAG: Hpt domain-containing protein, partial [Planctomycetota bacterium]